MSVATLIGFVWIMYQFALGPSASAEPEVARAVGASKGGSSSAHRGPGGRHKRRRR
jgi:hypothetical protein